MKGLLRRRLGRSLQKHRKETPHQTRRGDKGCISQGNLRLRPGYHRVPPGVGVCWDPVVVWPNTMGGLENED